MAKLRSSLVLGKRLHAGVTAPRQYLTGIDILHGHVGVPVVLVYKKGFDLAQAERGLSEVLKHYPILAGRYKTDEQGQVYVDINDAGIDFGVHRCEGNLPYGEHNPLGTEIKQFHKLLLPFQWIDRDTPLMHVNVYQYEDGGIVLCCYVPHSMFDGASIWGFMQDWSKACLGIEIKPPTFDRGAMIKAGQSDIDTAGYELVYQPRLSTFISTMSQMGWRAVTDMHKEIVRIPAATVQHWKEQAKIDLPNATGGGTIKLVTAYVMKAFSSVMPHGVPRSVGLALDLRYMRELGLPRDYFGNAVCYAQALYTEQEMAQDSLALLAEKCRPVPEQISTESQFKLLALAERYRQKKALWKLLFKPAVDTLHGGIIQNNLSQLPMYEIDLGRGTPDWYDIFPMTIRMLMVVQTPQKDGGVDLHLTARKAELKALRAQMATDGVPDTRKVSSASHAH
jgi:shikimate O-hydroxycinnamoyltransferase